MFSMYGNHSMECTVWRGAADSGTDCAIPRHGRRVYDGSAARARSWGQGMCRAVAGKKYSERIGTIGLCSDNNHIFFGSEAGGKVVPKVVTAQLLTGVRVRPFSSRRS